MTQNNSGRHGPAIRPARFGPRVRNTALVLGLLLCALMAHAPRPAAAHGQHSIPLEFNAAACYGLVQDAGRHIAWARWEQGLPVEKTRSAVLRGDTPSWAVDLENDWIGDAYEWRASSEQIQQWAAELGSVDDLPSAQQLSVHETIAIWMRRIGRECAQRAANAPATAHVMRVNLPVMQ